ncbi:Metallo-dependent hydrolase [Ramaria rubella]|nr:Metallo-dependent hydrolase [Ramaria rubella]
MTARKMPLPLIFYGALITPESPRSIKYLPRAMISVYEGIIEWIEEDVANDTRLDAILTARGVQEKNITRLQRGEFLLPGFIDTHTHAPQFPNLGRGGQYELLDWLSELTFPTEAKFGEERYANRVYRSVVKRLLDCGTTTCCYFSSTHITGTKILADAVNEIGQRAFIGHCNIDRNAPPSYRDPSHVESLANSRSMISYIKSLNAPLIRPILTPRFAISCTDDLLKGLGELATEDSIAISGSSLNNNRSSPSSRLPIQTHISENVAENVLTASLFPTHASYASVYDDNGLLGPTTILAHGCHLSSDEVALIKKSGAGISHCPTSNFNLTSGVAAVGAWLDAGVKVGLGTDVSGGFSLSMLTAIQHASMASKVVALQTPSPALVGTSTSITSTPPQSLDPVADMYTHFANRPLPTAALLYMATLGGAELCNLEESTGSLAPGKAFDALLVDLRSQMGNPNVWWDPEESARLISPGELADLEASLEKFLFCGDDRNISAVYVQGTLVGGQRFCKEDWVFR